MKKIVLTGGGSAGHVTPNLALIPALQAQGWSIDYIGSEQGMERAMLQAAHIPYHAIQTGKLRRYFSWKNIVDPFRVLVGIVQAYLLLRRIKPQVVFSKGGFVALPVVIAAWLVRIPIVAHESDFSIGLANRLSFYFVHTICVTFPAAAKHLKNSAKVVVTGTPIRESLFQGDRSKGLQYCKFETDKPCLLVIGGGQGAQSINRCIREALPRLLQVMHVIHICGPGKVDSNWQNQEGYCQLDYVNAELADLFAASDWVVSRAGANSLYELLALAKPHILVPLPNTQSRGDQIENARHFERLGISYVIPDDKLSPDVLLETIQSLQNNQSHVQTAIAALHLQPAVQPIVQILEGFCKNGKDIL